MKKLVILLLIISLPALASAQGEVYQCYPPHWWTGMKWNKLQLMVHGERIANHFPMVKMGPNGMSLAKGVNLVKINRVENPNYIFLDLVIDATAKPGKIRFPFVTGVDMQFELLPGREGNGTVYAQGISGKDLLYLVMPDRFSNGDESNDRIPGMRDQSLNRDTVYNRHGGDLKGIQNHLDYLDDLGVTTLWLNPVIENDRPERTEHGYAFTNHYKIDPRLGGEKAYRELIDAVHKKGMKIIQDAVYNHVDRFHLTVVDMPMKDWLHRWDTGFTQTNYKDQAAFDPYAAHGDRLQLTDGWFTDEMPDLNQSNPYVANFLIQHALWTVEEFGIDGWRIDTYVYNDLEFMNRCNRALEEDFPRITMFGETWVHGVPNQSYLCQNNYNIPFKSNLQAATDFQTLWGIKDAMTKDFGWTDGVNRLYTTLAQDFVYKDPSRNVIFLDNHDMSRFYSEVKEDMDKYLSSLSWLMTSRGIPQLYYGDELATTGITSPSDGYVRLDFPGGWKNDPVNKFTIQGRSQKDQAIFQHLATLANFRKTSPALTMGKFMQFFPVDGVYVYFRYNSKQTIMVVMNTSKEEKTIKLDRYTERTNGFTRYRDVITKSTGMLGSFRLGSYKTAVYELLK